MWTEKVPRSWQEGQTVRGRRSRGERHCSAELLDAKLGTQPGKRELWLSSQTQGPENFYSPNCQTPACLFLQAEPDITTSLAEQPEGMGSAPSSEPNSKYFQDSPRPPDNAQAPHPTCQALHYVTRQLHPPPCASATLNTLKPRFLHAPVPSMFSSPEASLLEL